MRSRRWIIAVTLLWLAVAPAARAAAKPALVLAAASLQDALTEAADRYAAQGRPKPVLSFAGSALLARQIESGAPADMFISADETWMDYLADRRLIAAGTRASFLSNRLVLIAPAGNPFTAEIKAGFPLASILGSGRLVMGEPGSVPAGKYGKAALANLGVWPSVEARVVYADNVRAALAFVERGEARAGIVYATDAAISRKVMVAGTFPQNSHPPISYPLALVGSQPNPEAAAFRAFLLSQPGRAVFTKYGFISK